MYFTDKIPIYHYISFDYFISLDEVSYYTKLNYEVNENTFTYEGFRDLFNTPEKNMFQGSRLEYMSYLKEIVPYSRLVRGFIIL